MEQKRLTPYPLIKKVLKAFFRTKLRADEEVIGNSDAEIAKELGVTLAIVNHITRKHLNAKYEQLNFRINNNIKRRAMVKIKIKDLKKPYYMYGNKGCLWAGTAHIAEGGSFSGVTLCGVPMLASNWCAIEKVDEIGCPNCIEIYNGIKHTGNEKKDDK